MPFVSIKLSEWFLHIMVQWFNDDLPGWNNTNPSRQTQLPPNNTSLYLGRGPRKQDSSDHQDDIPFLVGDPYLNLHLQLASCEGATSNLYQILRFQTPQTNAALIWDQKSGVQKGHVAGENPGFSDGFLLSEKVPWFFGNEKVVCWSF